MALVPASITPGDAPGSHAGPRLRVSLSCPAAQTRPAQSSAAAAGWLSLPSLLSPLSPGLSLTGHLHLGLALQQGSHPVADDAAVETGVRAVQRGDHVPAGGSSTEHSARCGWRGTASDCHSPQEGLQVPRQHHNCRAATPAPGPFPKPQLLEVRVHMCVQAGGPTQSPPGTEGLTCKPPATELVALLLPGAAKVTPARRRPRSPPLLRASSRHPPACPRCCCPGWEVLGKQLWSCQKQDSTWDLQAVLPSP